MNYRFTLIYLDTYSLSEQETEIIEPKGFVDGFTSELRRDFDYHGVFFVLSADDITLEFPGDAKDIIEEQFNAFGFDAVITIRIERREDDYSAYSTVYTGQAVIDSLRITADYAALSFEEKNLLIDLNNNLDVNIDAAQTTAITGDTITAAPTESVILRGRAIDRASSLVGDSGVNDFVITAGTTPIDIQPPTAQANKDQISYADGSKAFRKRSPETLSISVKNYLTIGNLLAVAEDGDFNEATLTVQFNWDYTRSASGDPGETFEIALIRYEVDTDDGTISAGPTVENVLLTRAGNSAPATGTATYTTTVAVIPGKFIAFQLAVYDGITTIDWEVDLNTFTFDIKATTTSAQSTATAIKLIDVLNHNIAALTGLENRVESDILGPGGCLEYLYETNGYKLRQLANPIIGNMAQRVKALKTIFNIGWGLELDYAGNEIIRVEGIDHFYRDVELVSFTEIAIDSYSEEIYPALAFNKVELGFAKYANDEGEAGTLDDVHTEAQFLTSVKNLTSAYTWISEHIASDLLIELTRRKRGNTTESTEYDEDLFLLDCFLDYDTDLKLAYPLDLDLQTENITNGGTGSNYRLNLRFNFFNHAKVINASLFAKAGTETTKVQSYLASKGTQKKIGYIAGAEVDCIGDTRNYINANLPRLDADIQKQETSTALFLPKLINFKVALTAEEVNTIILAHRNVGAGAYGYVSVTNPDGVVKQGYILTMRYTEIDRIADFQLIEKV